jgi:hypothetical protein
MSFEMEMNEDYLAINKEARRLSKRHDRSFSLILFHGEESYREDGDRGNAIREMRAYCHNKRVLGHGTG